MRSTLSSAATVGGVAAGAGNILARNAADGVVVAGGVGSVIRGNSIFGNGGLGIDLSDNGRSPNDLTDSDAGPNLTQNFPVLIAATISGGNLFVTYSVNSDPGNAAYPLTVDFYESDLLGQGRVYLGSNTYTAADFTVGAKIVNLGNAGVLGVVQPEPLVAVATDSGANSSEFSDARLVGIGGPTSFTVNTVNDGDDGLCDIVHCSLREAIQYANLNSGFADTIPFNIPGLAAVQHRAGLAAAGDHRSGDRQRGHPAGLRRHADRRAQRHRRERRSRPAPALGGERDAARSGDQPLQQRRHPDRQQPVGHRRRQLHRHRHRRSEPRREMAPTASRSRPGATTLSSAARPSPTAT